MNWLVAGIGIGLLFWALIWIGINARASAVVRWIKWVIIAILLGVLVAFVVNGRIFHVFGTGLMLLPVLFPWKRRLAEFQRQQREWTGHQAGSRSPDGSGMTPDDAAEILGVDRNADTETVRAAYHKLMAEHHPDKGGSTWYARQINAARDVLLRHHGGNRGRRKRN